jgi:signal transduction histidine kinase
MTLASGLSVLQSRRHELPERSQTALDLLADEIQRFQRMVQDLLEISRTDAGHTDISFEEVLAGEFVRRVAEQYENDVPIRCEGDTEEAILEVDKRRMVRVIGNLIENADRYAGGITEIAIVPAGKNIQIRLDDAGPGVPVNERERIFERFARGETARARASGEGTGLGLSLVEEHVRLHGGRVWVEDSPAGGARFVVELPREG